jgi:hypothetical protein
LAMQMLAMNPKNRASAAELLKDSLFSSGVGDSCECEDYMAREECCSRSAVLQQKIKKLEAFIRSNGLEVQYQHLNDKD